MARIGGVRCHSTLDSRMVAYIFGEPTVRIPSPRGLFESYRPEQEKIHSFLQEAVTPRVRGCKSFLD